MYVKSPCQVCKHAVRLRNGEFLGCSKDSGIVEEDQMEDEKCPDFEMDG